MTTATETAISNDNADLTAEASKLNVLPIAEALTRIANSNGKFFSVSFKRKTAKKVNGVVIAPKGSIRKMLCRTGVAKYVTGTGNGNRKAEDARNEVLTVWDIAEYQLKRKQGMSQESAGNGSYRRINVADIKEMSL